MPWALALCSTCRCLNAPCERVLVCLCLLCLLVNCNDFDPGKRPINKLDSSDPFKLNDPFQPFPGNDSPKEKDPDMFCDPFTSSSTTANKEAEPSNFANFSAVSTVNGLFGENLSISSLKSFQRFLNNLPNLHHFINILKFIFILPLPKQNLCLVLFCWFLDNFHC